MVSSTRATRTAGSAALTHVGTSPTQRGLRTRTWCACARPRRFGVVRDCGRAEGRSRWLEIAGPCSDVRAVAFVNGALPSLPTLPHSLPARTHKRPGTQQWSRRPMPKTTCLVTLFFFLCKIPGKPESDALVSYPPPSASFYEMPTAPHHFVPPSIACACGVCFLHCGKVRWLCVVSCARGVLCVYCCFPLLAGGGMWSVPRAFLVPRHPTNTARVAQRKPRVPRWPTARPQRKSTFACCKLHFLALHAPSASARICR